MACIHPIFIKALFQPPKFSALKISRHFSTSTSKNSSHPWSVLFFGTDDYSIFALESLLKHRQKSPASIIQNLGVCSRFTLPACKLAKFASNTANLPSYEYSPDLQLTKWDIGLVASFGHLIPPEIISKFPHGILCIHPSVLPRWRGASPIMQTILHGDSISGVSLMRIMPSKFDIGPILRQEEMDVPENITSRQMGAKLMQCGVDLFLDVLERDPSSFEVSAPQKLEGVTYAKKIRLDNTFINWQWDLRVIDRFQRALLEDFGVRTYWGDTVVQVTGFLPVDTAHLLRIDQACSWTAKAICGEFYFHKKRKVLFVRCGDGWMGLTGVSLPDRLPMSGVDFYNGFLSPGKNLPTFFQTYPGGKSDGVVETRGV